MTREHLEQFKPLQIEAKALGDEIARHEQLLINCRLAQKRIKEIGVVLSAPEHIQTLETAVSLGEKYEQTIIDTIGAVKSRHNKILRQVEEIEDFVMSLPPKEGQVIYHRYILGMTWHEVARKLNFNEAYLHRLCANYITNSKKRGRKKKNPTAPWQVVG